MKLDKGTLYWSRGCVTETDSKGEITSCRSIKDCHKLTVYNWLQNIPADREYNIFEVRFKNTRKGFFRNVNALELKEGNIVAVEASPGHDIGIISALGPVAEIKFRKSNPTVADLELAELKKIYRLARPGDIEKWQEAVSSEYSTMIQSRKMATSLGLNMKIGDVDFQGDKTKAIFYYIADERVDFRELIKVMADSFRIRVEMRQIGARQEAGLIGGIGPCGRELCCAQWMRNFVSVSTSTVRYQEISVNPLKLAGQCSKLKCCLNYELDTYLDAWEAFPKIKQLDTINGTVFLQKTDVLKGVMYFSSSESPQIYPISVNRVVEIMALNRNGEKVELSIISEDTVSEFKSAVGEDSLTRFDRNNRQKQKNKIKPSSNKQRNYAPQEKQQQEKRLQDGQPQEENTPKKKLNRNSNNNNRNNNNRKDVTKNNNT